MSWKDRGDLGKQVVADTYDLLAPPADWTLEKPDGFVWWPCGLAQRVWADDGVFRNSRTYYRLHAEIDLLKGHSHREAIASILEEAMDDCVLSCLVYDKRTDIFRLHASVFAEEELWDWVGPVFAAAATSQLSNSQKIIRAVQDSLHPVMAVTSHPKSGLRVDKDDRLDETHSPFIASGAPRSKWASSEEWHKVDWALERQASAFQPSNLRSSLSKFYWAPDAHRWIELFISSDEPHPGLGNGLHFTLCIPLELSTQHIAHMALELNEYERANWLNTHLLGSWCNHNKTLAFRLFVPNALYKEGLLEGLAITMASRAVWTNEYFTQLKADAEKRRESHA